VPDVRVYLNRQELGRTDAAGEVFVPRVVSYVENHLSIDDRDVPIERMLVDKDRLLVPGARRGDVVTFSAPQVRAVTGIVQVRRGGRDVPLELTVFALDTPAGPLDVPVGRGGEFYVENLAPGAYRAHLAGTPPCDFTVTIPDTHEAFTRLDPIVACARP
jgi:outer membrane usher protein FimD/PapC